MIIEEDFNHNNIKVEIPGVGIVHKREDILVGLKGQVVFFTPQGTTMQIPLCFGFGIAEKSFGYGLSGIYEQAMLQEVKRIDASLVPEVYNATEGTLEVESLPAVNFQWLYQNMLVAPIPDPYKAAIVCYALMQAFDSYATLDRFGIKHTDISTKNIIMRLDNARVKLIDFEDSPSFLPYHGSNVSIALDIFSSSFSSLFRTFGIKHFTPDALEGYIKEVLHCESVDEEVQSNIAYYLQIAYIGQIVTMSSHMFQHVHLESESFEQIWQAVYKLALGR